MSDYLPGKNNGKGTVVTTGDVIGGRLINVAGTHAGADDATFTGVASHDALTGKKVGFYPIPGVIHRLVASAAIAKGARVKPAAAGKVALFTSGTDADQLLVGIALQAAAADLDVIEVLGR